MTNDPKTPPPDPDELDLDRTIPPQPARPKPDEDDELDLERTIPPQPSELERTLPPRPAANDEEEHHEEEEDDEDDDFDLEATLAPGVTFGAPPPAAPQSPWSGAESPGAGEPEPPANPWAKPQPITSLPERADEPSGDDILDQKSKRVRRLGVGGQGEVWLVEHLGQLEAHKFLPAGRGAEEAVFREALHTRKVDHPNIVRVFGTEMVGDVPVLRMEHVKGKDLATLVDEEGVLPVERIVPLAIQITDALQTTHERGLIHHDLKPSNLILRDDGNTVVVTDFGISDALRQRGDAKPDGSGGGTPYFMAPELHRGGRGSPRSDIWSLGVTLYYLLCADYPFPFDKMAPADAVEEEPRDLTRNHLYVPGEFWRILRHMLSADAKTGYGSMQEVKQDLEAYADRIACHACGKTYSVGNVPENCPETECPVNALLRAREASRAAETALTHCDFGPAAKGFETAAAAWEEAGLADAAADARARGEGVADYETALADQVAQARDLLERERFIECVHVVQKARTRFSRSDDVRDVRAKVRDKLAEIHAATEGTVREALGDHDFKAARAALTRADQILGDPRARNELVSTLGELPKSFHQLYSNVEQKELTFNRYVEKAHEALSAFQFDKALRVYTVLETEFPSERNVEMLARLRRAPATYGYALKYPEEVLKKVIANPGILAEARKIRLKKVNRACRKLLNDFSDETYPNFGKIRRLKELTTAASDAVQTYVRDKLTEAKEAEEAQQTFEELELIRSIEALVTRSDLFELDTRQHVLRRLRALDERVTRAERHYKDGTAALAEREYVKAQVAFREVNLLVPDGYKDTPALIEQVETLRPKLSAMTQEVSYELGEIERGHFTLDSATETFRRVEELHEIAGPSARAKLVERVRTALTVLLDSQRDHVLTLPPHDPSSFLDFLASNFVPLVGALPDERWRELLEGAAELNRAGCALLFDGYAGQRKQQPLDLTREIDYAGRFAAVLEPARDIVRRLQAPLGTTHPAAGAAGLVEAAFESARQAEREDHLDASVAAFERLAGFAPDVVARDLRERVESFHAWRRRAKFETGMRRAVGVLKLVGPYVAVLLVALFVGRWWGTSGAEAEAEMGVDRMLASLAFPDDYETAVRELLVAEDAGAVGPLTEWAELRRRLDEGQEAGGAAYWIAGVGLSRRADAITRHGSLQRHFRGTIKSALREALRRIFLDAGTAISSTRSPGLGVQQAVRMRLEELHGQLPGTEFWAGVRDNLDALRGAVDPLLGKFRFATGDYGDVDAHIAAIRRIGDGNDLLDSESATAVQQWLATELRRALADALAARTRQAADGNVAGFLEQAESALAASAALRGVGALPLMVEDDGSLDALVLRAISMVADG